MSEKVAESGKKMPEEKPVEVEVEVDGLEGVGGVASSNSPEPEPKPDAPAEDGGGSNEGLTMTESEFHSESAENVVKVGQEIQQEEERILGAIETKEIEVDEEKNGGEAVEAMDVQATMEQSQSSSDNTPVSQTEPKVSFSFFKLPESTAYLENVGRVELIKMHRNLVKQSQKKLSEQRQRALGKEKRFSSFSIKMTFAKLPLNFKVINLNQLERIVETKNKKYDLEDRYIGRLFEDFDFLDGDVEEFRKSSKTLRELRASRKRLILSLVVLEDPVWMPLECTTHFLTQDSNGDVIPLSVSRSMPVPISCSPSQESSLNNESSKENAPHLGHGSRLILIGPEQCVTSWPQDPTKNHLHVIFPQDVLVDNGRFIDMCRYCGQENAGIKCEKCQETKYCSEECQTNDREKLGHQLICVAK